MGSENINSYHGIFYSRVYRIGLFYNKFVKIPQGMAYALLASVPPIYGLYTSFYPVLIYWIFGTSRQLSLGTFAVVSLMVADTLSSMETKYAPPVGFNSTDISNTTFLSPNREKARIMIVMANAFWVGVIQVGMSVCQLGFITSYLSEPLVNSFLAGTSVHVGTSQLKFLFGLHMTPYTGLFKIPKVNLLKAISFNIQMSSFHLFFKNFSY